ncbi:Leucine Rich Repeat family [Chlorella sorokiniana]|uniref:Leucine Rich Repeat family n=1 Tax=Chlorella sorokiniana TaxID=3076 RepID=A0A2P6TNX1_CHLSO|nr:Leucine Rich Repeat family [Chlorella sorokiniana]|eukprot:PRW51022.1 Leucine Rich Repeat family [Chlorella sorokiniana]
MGGGSCGVLVLDDRHAGLPGGVLSHVEATVHYLDLAGIQARSLRDFGGRAELWGKVTKLYASSSGLQSLDGLEQLSTIRFLYLDHNSLAESELLRLPDVLPAGVRLETLDLRGNPGLTPAVETALESSPLLARTEFFNGRRLRR